MKIAAGLVAATALLLVMALVPLPLPAYLDFQVMYHADLGLLRGIPVYDHAGQVNLIARIANVAPEQVYILPFPYPPWYALVTVWLALLPINVAARVWFGLNLMMLYLSVWVLTDGLPRVRRLAFTFPAIIFPPVLGSLFVGQYVFPVLLGSALLVRALQRRSALLVAVSAALLTFKPHLGGMILLIAAAYLWWRRDEPGRWALPGLLMTGATLFALGFLASPAWPAAYLHSLTGFGGIPGVARCNQCSSLPAMLGKSLGGGLGAAGLVAAALLVLLAGWLIANRAALRERPGLLVAAGALLTLVVSPYLLNYDYVLLLVPFAVMGEESRGRDWAWLGVAYALPFVALSIYGSGANTSLVVSAVMLSFLVARRLSRTGEKSSARA